MQKETPFSNDWTWKFYIERVFWWCILISTTSHALLKWYFYVRTFFSWFCSVLRIPHWWLDFFICQNCVVLHLEKSGNVVFRPDFVTPATLSVGVLLPGWDPKRGPFSQSPDLLQFTQRWSSLSLESTAASATATSWISYQSNVTLANPNSATTTSCTTPIPVPSSTPRMPR